MPFNPQPLPKEKIDKAFNEAEHQTEYTIALYRIAYPTLWDQIEKVHGWPKVSKTTNEYIFGKAIEFDREHHPNVMAGGLWMNNGFGSKEDAKDWTVYPTEVRLKGEA